MPGSHHRVATDAVKRCRAPKMKNPAGAGVFERVCLSAQNLKPIPAMTWLELKLTLVFGEVS